MGKLKNPEIIAEEVLYAANKKNFFSFTYFYYIRLLSFGLQKVRA